MAVVLPADPRATLEETPQGLQVIIPAKRNLLTTLFLGFWLCGWAMGEIMVPVAFFRGDVDPGAMLFVIAWLAIWTIGGGVAFYVFFWQIAGHERVLLTPSSLSIKREVFGVGRTREYLLTHLRNLRVSPPNFNPFDFRAGLQFWGIGGGPITFDHGAATIRFGAGLEESEARSVVEQLRSRASFGESAA